MKNAFDANVPRQRPLGQKKAAASAAATTSEAAAAPVARPAPAEPAPPPAEDAAEKLRAHMQARARKGKATEALAEVVQGKQEQAARSRVDLAHSVAAAVAGEPVAAIPEAGSQVPAPAPAEAAPGQARAAWAVAATPTGEDTVARGQQRIARLRERLEAAVRAGTDEGPLEPRAATEAARQLVDGFRARLRSLGEERDALEGSLALARAEIQALREKIAEGQRRLEAAEATARERVELSRNLLAETESLAAERDQALGRIAELKALDEQQTRLLGDAEAALLARDEAIAGLEARQAEQARLLEARAAEVAELTGRVARRTAERDEQLARVQALEAEVRGLQESRLALAEIKRMVEAAKL